MRQSNRTSHQVNLNGSSAKEAIKQAIRQHKAGKGRKKADSTYDVNNGSLAGNARKWFQKNGKQIRRKEGRVQEIKPGKRHEMTEKGRKALEAGGRIKEHANGAKVIHGPNGRIVQHLRGPNRATGKFTTEETVAQARARQQNDAWQAIRDFFPKNYDPSSLQVQGVWAGYKAHAQAEGWFVPDIDPAKL